MKNHDKRQKKKRDFLKDYLNKKIKNWKSKLGKAPTSNYKNVGIAEKRKVDAHTMYTFLFDK